MTLTRRQFLRASGLAASYMALPAFLTGCASAATTAPTALPHPESWVADDSDAHATVDPALLHILQRLTYGPSSADIALIQKLGSAAFIEQQLHPEKIDDRDLERQLASFSTLALSSAELFKQYPRKDPGPQHIMSELQQASLLRAALSKRQLYEIMVDVWSNHFNIYQGKSLDKWLKTVDDRETIRPHALGKFRDLLLASAKSPAMLFYLDNVDNIVPESRKGKQSKGGINENYARELLELHTIGVDAGYDHDDIVEVARVFTGWSIARPQEAQAGSFVFRPQLHDNGAKHIKVLKLTLPEKGGIKDGELLLAQLAIDPRTAQRIAYKLCVRFVSDTPPQTLVDRLAQVYLRNDTDIRATLKALFEAPEFLAAPPKIKLPTHALVSMLRALNANLQPSAKLIALLQDLGQPFFGWQAPDGYPQIGAAWVNTSGLLARWNTAFALVEGRYPTISVDLQQLVPGSPTLTAAALVDAIGKSILHTTFADDARTALISYISPTADPTTVLDTVTYQRVLPELAGLALASPVFQMY